MSQPSSIDRLPAGIREQLQAMLDEPAITQEEARERINAILKQMGRPERLSRSAVNRYAIKMEEIGAKMRESREIADTWIERLGTEPQGEVGKLLTQMVRYLAFESTMNMAEGEATMQPKMLKDLAIAIERLERAASQRAKREEEIRRAERERIKEELEKAVAAESEKPAGRRVLDAETIKSIREQLKL